MKLKLIYHYDPTINNSRVCEVFIEGGKKKIAEGYDHQDFSQAKWSALREAQRILTIKPVVVPKSEHVVVDWGLNG